MTIKWSYSPRRTSLLILSIFLAGILVGSYVERFRISDYRWIYVYGSYTKLVLGYGAIVWSFLHPLLVWSERKTDWKNYWIWILIGLLPFLYLLRGIIRIV